MGMTLPQLQHINYQRSLEEQFCLTVAPLKVVQ